MIAMSSLRSWLRVALSDLSFDLRRFAVLLGCIALGVATIAAVGSVGTALNDAIGRDARAFLGGDLEASIGYRPATADEQALFRHLGRVTEVIEVASRATFGGKSALVALRGVDGAYPLVGSVATTPDTSLSELLAMRDGMFGAVADGLLFDRLGAKPGDIIRIGDARFRLAGRLDALPDQAARGFSIGASVLVPTASLASTGILQPGVLARYRYKIDLGGGDYNAAAEAIAAQFPDAGWQVRSPREATAGLARYLDIFSRFLTLVGLSSLLVGGIGVANAVSAYVTERERSIAILRSLGATGGRILVHFLAQIMLLGVVGTGLGLGLGAASTLVVLPILGGYLQIALPPALYPLPLLTGFGFGLLIAFVFAYLPLLRAAQLNPATLFRAAGGIVGSVGAWRAVRRWWRSLPLGLGLVALLGLAFGTTREPTLLGWYGAGAIAAVVLLRLLAWLLQRIVRRLPSARALPLRLALRNIFRPGAPTATVVLSLGLGLTLMISIALVEASVRDQLSGRLRTGAPSFVLMNVDKPTATDVSAFAKGNQGVASLTFTPFLRGIVSKINGKPPSAIKTLDARAQRVLGGDESLSWSAQLPAGDAVLEGKWWAADYSGPPLVSLDADFARLVGVHVGDTLEITISGRPITVSVANIRQVDWQNGSLSFDILFSPGLIAAAPQTAIGALKAAPGQEAKVEAALVGNFPTLGFIPVGDVLVQISSIVGALANAVAIVGGVALISGVLVLAGALAAGRRQREADAVVAKVLGATRRQLSLAFIVEYGLLGLLAAFAATGLGAFAGWLIVTRLFELSFAFDLPLMVAVALAAVAATILTGLATTWSALSAHPAAFLRAEE